MSVPTFGVGNNFVRKDDYAALLASHKRLVKALEEYTKSCVDCVMLMNRNMLCPKCTKTREALRLARELEEA